MYVALKTGKRGLQHVVVYIRWTCSQEEFTLHIRVHTKTHFLVSSRVTMDSQDNFTVFSRVNNMDHQEEFTVFSRVYSRIPRRHHGNQDGLIVCSQIHTMDNH